MKSCMAQQMCAYMRMNCSTISLKGMAAHFCYHPCTVEVILRRETGKSFTLLLRDIRMDEAARLLREEHITVQEAAYRCGYSHMTSFYRRFQARYGVTPGAYARSVSADDQPGSIRAYGNLH